MKPSLKHSQITTIIHLYTRKGNNQTCNNHQGIPLMSVESKILVKLILNHLTTHVDNDLLTEVSMDSGKNMEPPIGCLLQDSYK